MIAVTVVTARPAEPARFGLSQRATETYTEILDSIEAKHVHGRRRAGSRTWIEAEAAKVRAMEQTAMTAEVYEQARSGLLDFIWEEMRLAYAEARAAGGSRQRGRDDDRGRRSEEVAVLKHFVREWWHPPGTAFGNRLASKIALLPGQTQRVPELYHRLGILPSQRLRASSLVVSRLNV